MTPPKDCHLMSLEPHHHERLKRPRAALIHGLHLHRSEDQGISSDLNSGSQNTVEWREEPCLVVFRNVPTIRHSSSPAKPARVAFPIRRVR